MQTGASWLVPAATNAGCERSEQMPECAGNTMESNANEVVPAPRLELGTP